MPESSSAKKKSWNAYTLTELAPLSLFHCFSPTRVPSSRTAGLYPIIVKLVTGFGEALEHLAIFELLAHHCVARSHCCQEIRRDAYGRCICF